MSTEIRPMALEHWSLHKGFDVYELLVQIRPNDAYDGISMHRIGENVSDLLQSLAVRDGRVPTGGAELAVVWFRSEWRRLDDGSFQITKAAVNQDDNADDVMIVASQSLVVGGAS